tara:strand:- start:212 stop:376 length:165 start_codon:yes stop_codon:yes gene_type:complete
MDIIKAKTKLAKELFKSKDYLELNNSYDIAHFVALWCNETDNDFKSNFEIVKNI